MIKAKNKFLISTIILMFSGFFTKIFGLIIKIIITRICGDKVISLYTLVMPTYSLFLTIVTFSMPSTIAKLISSKKNNNILNNALLIIVIINIFFIFLMIKIAPYIANNLLKEPDTYYLLIAMTFTFLPASIACILKGYFYGIQKMSPHAISNLIEQLIRLSLIIYIMPKLIKISYIHAAIGLILTSTITEISSIITFLCFMNKKDKIDLTKININKNDINNILSLSFYNVSSKITGNICYFLEPIILTNILLYVGYSKEYILLEYGYYNAYAISTLTIPSFFISAISLSLLPEISKYETDKNYYMVKKRLKEAIIYTLILGIFFSTIIFIFHNNILYFLYHTYNGNNYIKYLSFFFILFYLESILSSFMQAIGKIKITFKISFITSIIKIIMITILSFCKIGLYSLLISEIINIILIVIMNFIYINNYFANKKVSF